MQQYKDLVETVLREGILKPNRTGVDTISYHAYHAKYNLRGQLPLLTTKYVPWKKVLIELLWYLRGEDHIRFLWENNTHIWDEWAKEDGYLGPAYPVLWRRFPKICSYDDYVSDKRFQDSDGVAETYVNEYDQIKNICELLEKNPLSRRIVLSTWYPGLESEMGLPPCHLLAIWNCQPLDLEQRLSEAQYHSGDSKSFVSDLFGGRVGDMSTVDMQEKLDELGVPRYFLNCHLTQRSADIALGVPFNIACYSALTKIFAHLYNMIPKEFSHLTVDSHIYENHIEGLQMQMQRPTGPLPELKINPDLKNIDDLKLSDLEVVDYNPMPKIKFEVAV